MESHARGARRMSARRPAGTFRQSASLMPVRVRVRTGASEVKAVSVTLPNLVSELEGVVWA